MDNNSTTINDDDSLDTPETCLVKILKFVASNSNCSHWFRFFDRPGDNPSSESRRLMNKEDVVKIDQFNELSFQRFLGIDEDLYSWMFVQCGIAKFLPDGSMRLRSNNFWEGFITKHDIEAEIVTANLMQTKVRYYIRIGPKSTTCTWYTSVLKQIRDRKFSPPRCPNLEVIARRVNGKLRTMYEEYIEQQKKKEEEEKERNNNNANHPAATLPPPVINHPPPSKFPLMDKYGLDQIDMGTEEGSKRMKRLLGEIIAKQQLQTENKYNNSKFEYYRPQQAQISTAVSIRSHTSEKAFRSFHSKNPYLEDVIGALDPNKKIGAQRLSDYLAEKHQRQFVEAALLIRPAIERALDPTTKVKKSKKEKKKKRAVDENGGGGKIAAKKPKKSVEPRTVMEQAAAGRGIQVVQAQAQSVGVQAEIFRGKSLPTIDDMYK